jgi:hypothetical protein
VIDYARGRVILESSDEEEEITDQESESDSDSEEEDVELGPGSKRNRRQEEEEEEEPEIDLNEDILEEEETSQTRIEGQEEDEEESRPQIHPTRRIAVVNLDWDHLKPIDIYKVFSSVLTVPIHQPQPPQPPSTATDTKHNKTGRPNQRLEGRVERVQVYKSQFGKERMKREDEEGPPPEIFKTSVRVSHEDEDEDEDEGLVEVDNGAEFDDQALRQYQLDRLRYYYAIVSLDSAITAQHVFAEIDGTEFERTANIFDLRSAS